MSRIRKALITAFAVGMTTFALPSGPPAVATTTIAPDIGPVFTPWCGEAQKVLMDRDAGGVAYRYCDKVGHRKIVGSVQDLKVDGKCARVRITFGTNGNVYSAKACGKGKKTAFDTGWQGEGYRSATVETWVS
jgi:hypothetical protein